MKLGEIAALLGGRLAGDPECQITGVSGLDTAAPGDITFLSKKSSREALPETRASCIIVSPDAFTPGAQIFQLEVDDPQLGFIKLLAAFQKPLNHPRGISQGAVVKEGTGVSAEASLYPLCYVEEGATVGRGSVLYPGVFIGKGSSIGEDCIIYPNVTIREGVSIGNRVIIHAGTVVGSDGFGYTVREGRHVKIPHIGGVTIGDDVEIGACVTIDRATTGQTEIGGGTKIDNLVQVAHNVKIGRGALVVAQAGIAGSSALGDYVVVAGQAGIADHVKIEAGSILGANAGVMPGAELKKGAYAGSPVQPHREWLKSMAVLAKLPELSKKVSALEKKLLELEKEGHQ
ncbi:MAG: UDP-3-O-(3-hydroxymyristoyl)glucosamine N-acyltransferase [Actinomycetota bacterium]|nr:UDP-3-O-(3-hydroxymyristoyl)glucosamine N-acyltransferase [Actinomycetota bacterium]